MKKSAPFHIVDSWVVIKIKENDQEEYKVFASWIGSDSWKINSGIDKITQVDNNLLFWGKSGSVYQCKYDELHYGAMGYAGWILNDIVERNPNASILSFKDAKKYIEESL